MICFFGSQVGGGFLLKFLLIVFVVLLAGYPVFSQHFKENFESGIKDEFWAKEGHSNTVSTTYSISGKKAYKAHLPAQVYSNARSEIRFRGGKGTPNWHPHFTTWGIKLAVYFPANFKPDYTSSELIFQYHGVKDAGDTYTQNPWSMRLRGRTLSVTNRWISKKIASDADQHEKTWNLPGQIVPGKWHHFVVDIHWDYRPGGNGFMQVYMKVGSAPTKSNLVVNHQGPTGYNDDLTSYFKMGIYKWDWKDPARVTLSKANGVTERLLFYDDFEIKKNGFLVGSTNKSPNANAGPNKTITLPTNSITINGSATDPDGNLSTYNWTQVSGPSNATLVKEHTLNLEARNLKEGVYVFRLTVEDTDGASDNDDMLVTVNPQQNEDPNANAGPNRTITLPTNSITINGSASDPDNNISTYDWTQISGPDDANLVKEHTLKPEAKDLKEGVYVFRLTVEDTEGATDNDDMQVTVNPKQNEDPTADAGSNQSITLPTNQITIEGKGTDPDGNIDSYSWKQASGPSDATLTGKNTSDLTASDLIEGTYVFRLTVTDSDGASHDDGVQVIVNPAINEPPNANAGSNKTITLPTSKITVNGSGTDPDGTIKSFTWVQNSGPSTATLSGANQANLTASDLKEGTYVFKLTVKDNQGASDSDQMQVIVENPSLGQSPKVDAGADQTLILPDNSVVLNGSATDADGQIVSYQWSQVSGPSDATLTKRTTASLEVNDLLVGSYEFQLKAVDNEDRSNIDQVTVTVYEAMPAITAVIEHSYCAANNGALTLTLTGGAGPFQYSWSNGIDTKDQSGLESGDYQLTVTDKNGNSVTKSYSVDNVTADIQIATDIVNATCSENNGSIAVTASGGEGPYTFEWSSQARSSSLSELAGGSYDLVVVDQNGCSKKFSFEVGVDAGETVHEIASTTKNASCAGNDGSISLSATGPNAPYSFVWGHGATGSNLTNLEDGKYTVTITDKHGCYMNSEFTINQDPGPGKPTITQAGDSLYVTQHAVNYQWFKDSVAITGATNRALQITNSGTYSVQIYNDNNCASSSDFFYAKDPVTTVTGQGEFTMQQVEIYPNPAVSDINVRVILNEPAATSLTIYDLQGRIMQTRDLGVVNSQINENLRVDQYPSGTFLMRVKANKEIVTRRFIKQ